MEIILNKAMQIRFEMGLKGGLFVRQISTDSLKLISTLCHLRRLKIQSVLH